MFGATLNLVTRVGLTMIFGTLKDSSLNFSNLPLITYFSYNNVLQNGAKTLSKMVLKNLSFVKNMIILYISDHILWFKFCQHMVKIHIKQCMERL